MLKNTLWGSAFLGIMLLFSMMVSGCTDENAAGEQEPLSKNIVQDQDGNQTGSDLMVTSRYLFEANEVDRLTIITEDGSEINLDKEPFLTEMLGIMDTLTTTETHSTSFDYTIVLWTIHDEPVVMQVGKDVLKIGDTYYEGNTMVLLNDLVKKYAGNFYFQELNIDRIMISARDLGKTKQLSGESLQNMIETLRNARYLEEPPRLRDPLFPYYVLELDIGGKQIVEVDVLSPTLLSVAYGEERSYYQLEDSLFGSLKEQISLVDYSPHHVKYLYKTNELKLIDQGDYLPMGEIVLGGEDTDPLEMKALTHAFVRMLSQGEKDSNVSLEEQPSLMLLFQVNDERLQVPVYRNGFIYRQQPYAREGIFNDILNHIKEKNEN